MKILLLVLTIYAGVFASTKVYERSIRIGTYHTQEIAQDALEKLQAYVARHPRIIELQEKHHFIFKKRESGKYFITLAEPFRDKQVLEEVASILRKRYPDLYISHVTQPSVDKIVSTQEKVKKKESFETQEKETLKEVEDKKIPALEVIEKHEKKVEPQVKIVEKVVEKVILKEVKIPIDSIYTTLFYISLGVIFILILVIVFFKKRMSTLLYEQEREAENYKMLQKGLRNKEKLISYVSHELRTPMTAIQGLVHLVLESKLSKEQKDYLQKIDTSSVYMLNLLNDILDLSKIEAGKLEIYHSEFNIHDIVQYVYNVVSIKAKQNNVNLTICIEQDVPSKIIGDSLRLGQVLINLTSNAVKFTKDGDVTLHVSKKKNHAEEVTLTFSVEDTGIGMEEDEVKKLFHSYYQANGSIAKEYGGTGLGLNISQQLVEMMGGKIHVKSKKEKGTTFSFTLTFSLKDSQNKRQYRLPSANLLNKSVLIIDANNKNAIQLIQAFRYFKYKVETHASFETLDNFVENQYDIIVVNVQAINQKNLDILHEMQKVSQTKIVILNELYNTLQESIDEKIDVDAYFKPPITTQSVLNLIIELFIPKETQTITQEKSLKEQLKGYKGRKILVVEDNKLNFRVISGILEGTGIEVDLADNGEEALYKLQEDKEYDLVLMDINMPVLNGYEATAEIRKIEKLSKIPILALSADVSAEAIRKSFKSGMQGHLSKPINVDEFYSKIIEQFRFIYKPLTKDEERYEVLHVKNALVHVSNDVNAYKNMLIDFQLLYVNISATLYELCTDSDFELAIHKIIELKETAKKIGAFPLVTHLEKMEKEFLKTENGLWKKELEELHTLLTKLFDEIQRYIK